MNPMFRVAAAWQKVPVQQLTSEAVRTRQALGRHRARSRRGVLHVDGGGHLVDAGARPEQRQARPRYPGEARRQAARRCVASAGIVRTEFKDRTKVVYVPVDVATGKVLDPAFQPAPPSTPNFKVVG